MSRTLARPYARAAFEVAQAGNRLEPWEQFLASLSRILAHSMVSRILAHPRMDQSERVEIVTLALGKGLDPEEHNFILLLVQHDRLTVVADIATEYQILKMRAQSMIECLLTTAVPLDEQARQTWITRLAARFNRNVHLLCRTDPELLGGAELRVGDHVWDASIRGQIDRLSRLLTARI